MSKIKLLVGLAASMMTLVVVVAPATAEFSANQVSGPIVKFPEKTVFTTTQTGPPIECKSKNEAGEVIAEGGWLIQVKAYTQQGKYFYQEPATKGPHEALKITKWGHCVGPALFEGTVKCFLQVEIGGQNQSESSAGNATGSAYPPGCEVTFGSGANVCIVKVDANANKEQQGVTLSNGVNGVKIESNVATVSSSVQEKEKLCKTLGLTSGQRVGHFKTEGQFLETSGQKLA